MKPFTKNCTLTTQNNTQLKLPMRFMELMLGNITYCRSTIVYTLKYAITARVQPATLKEHGSGSAR